MALSAPVVVTIKRDTNKVHSVLFQDKSLTDTAISNVYIRKEHVPANAKAVEVTLRFVTD